LRAGGQGGRGYVDCDMVVTIIYLPYAEVIAEIHHQSVMIVAHRAEHSNRIPSDRDSWHRIQRSEGSGFVVRRIESEGSL
jgi:hypothetical protein